MNKKLFLFLLIIPVVFFAGCTKKQDNKDNIINDKKANISDLTGNNEIKNSMVQINTNMGTIELELFKKDAPNTVDNFIKLAKSGFYNGTKFHRVMEGFMIQGGDPNSKTDNKDDWGYGGPGYKFDDEINGHLLQQGTLAMANSGVNTNGSQFFIVTANATPWLDGKHTAFGKVVSGLDIVMNIEKVKTDEYDRPLSDVVVESIVVLNE